MRHSNFGRIFGWVSLSAACLILAVGCCGGKTDSSFKEFEKAPIATASETPKSASPKPTEVPKDPSRKGERRLPFKDTDIVVEVNKTLDLIESNGPFPYRQDGVVFQNREGRLPKRKKDCYHEYTVKTTGAPNRGARRIITGCESDYHFTQDHYNSFSDIDPKRY